MKTANVNDFSQIFEKMNVDYFANQYKDVFKFDVDVLKETQKKNMEALFNANQTIAEGSKTLVELQVKMMQDAMQEAVKTAQEVSKTTKPEDIPKKQIEVIQVAYETAMNNSKEISDMTKKLQDEIAEKVNIRVAEGIEEIKNALEKAK